VALVTAVNLIPGLGTSACCKQGQKKGGKKKKKGDLQIFGTAREFFSD